MEEREKQAQEEEMKKSIWYEAKKDLHDIDKQEKRLEQNQELLRQHLK